MLPLFGARWQGRFCQTSGKIWQSTATAAPTTPQSLVCGSYSAQLHGHLRWHPAGRCLLSAKTDIHLRLAIGGRPIPLSHRPFKSLASSSSAGRTARVNSIDFDVERPYDRCPFDDFILDKPLKLRRRGIQIWNKPGFNQHFLIIRLCERIMVRKCNLLNYCGRCPRRGKQANALLRGHARESLDRSGQVGRRSKAGWTGHSQDPQLTGTMISNELSGHCGRRHCHVTGDRVCGRRSGATIGNLNKVGQSSQRLEQFSREMVERANTSVTIRELAAIRFVVIDELLQRIGRDRRIDCDREGRHRNVGNRLKVSYRIVKRPGFEDCFGDVSARPTQQDGVAVRLRMGDGGCSKGTSTTALILDNNGSEQRLNSLR